MSLLDPQQTKTLQNILTETPPCWFIRSDDHITHKKSKIRPCRRWGHSSLIYNNKLYLYGGTSYGTSPRHLESVYQLDLEDWSWAKLDSINKAPPCRDSHSCVAYQNKLFIFGGSSGSESKNDLLEYDLASNTWNTISGTGSPPSPREGHIACLLEERYMIIYGGWNSEETFSDCYIFDIPQKNWLAVTSNIGIELPPLESQSCCVIKGYMYIFGGQSTNIKREGLVVDNFCNDIYRLKIIFENSEPAADWEKVEPLGIKPSRRSSHASCSFEDRYMFIIGGEGYPPGFDEENRAEDYRKFQDTKEEENNDEEYPCHSKNDVWCFDVESTQWIKVDTKKENDFQPRFAHTCQYVNDYIVIFGGLTDYNNSLNDICVLSLNGTNPFVIKKSQDKSDNTDLVVDWKHRMKMEEEEEEEKGAEKDSRPGVDLNQKPAMEENLQEIVSSKDYGMENSLGNSDAFMEIYENLVRKDDVFEECKLDIKESIQHNKQNKTSFDDLPSVFDIRSNNKPQFVQEKHEIEDSGRKNGIVSIPFLESITQLIGWPLAPFGLFLDNALIVQSSIFRISYCTNNHRNMSAGDRTNNPQVYLKIEDDGLGWEWSQFTSIMNNSDLTVPPVSRKSRPRQGEQIIDLNLVRRDYLNSKLNEYAVNLKMAALRLGKTCVFVSRNGTEVSIGLIDAGEKLSLQKYKNQIFYYSFDVNTGKFVSPKARENKSIILQILKGVGSETELLEEMDRVANKILVFNLNSILLGSIENQKDRFYELSYREQSPFNDENDIVIENNNFNLQYQDEEKTFSLVESSLRTYLSYFFLDPSAAKINLYLDNSPVQFSDFKDRIDHMASHENAVKFAELNLFEGIATIFSPQNIKGSRDVDQGVLIYYKNRLVRRMESPKFGDLDFFSSQYNLIQGYRQGERLFNINGYINLRDPFSPNIFKTEIENPYYSNYLYSVAGPYLSAVRSLNAKRNSSGFDKDEPEGGSGFKKFRHDKPYDLLI